MTSLQQKNRLLWSAGLVELGLEGCWIGFRGFLCICQEARLV